MKKLLILTLAFVLSACGEPATPKATRQYPMYVVILEDGGTITDDQKEQMRITTLNLLQQLTKLSRFASTRHSTINIIRTSRPNQIAFSGTPQQLADNANTVSKLVSYTNSYSDLVYSYEQVAATIKLNQPTDVRLYHVGVFLHAGFSNLNKPIDIKLPQAVPELSLPRFLDRVSTLRVMNYHPDQTGNLIDYFSKIGALQRKRDGSLDFKMLSAAEVNASLKKLL